MLSVVIPAYNESRRIRGTLEQIVSRIRSGHIEAEIVVVDDGSTDDTSEIVTHFLQGHGEVRLIPLPYNYGKGYALRVGLRSSLGEHVLFTDADLATPIEALELLMPWIRDYDIVIGSRADAYRAQEGTRTLKRRLVHLLGRYIRRSFIVRDIRDTQCGFKLLTRHAIDMICPKAKIDGYAFDMEMLVIAEQCGLRVREIEVPWNHNIQGRFRLGRASLSVLRDLFQIKMDQISGTYRDR